MTNADQNLELALTALLQHNVALAVQYINVARSYLQEA